MMAGIEVLLLEPGQYLLHFGLILHRIAKCQKPASFFGVFSIGVVD
jgi:hypothetical protein